MKRLVAFFEIPSVDFNRAIKFYETVLETKVTAHDWGEEKMAFFSDDTSDCCGAISWAEGFKPSNDGVLVSLNCDDMGKTISLIEQNGGTIITPKTQIEAADAGFFAVFIDSEGNRLGLWSKQ